MNDSTTSPAAVDAEARNGRVRYVGRRQGSSPYPKLKPSGVKWLGDVPEHWRVGPLKYFAALTMGQSPAGSAVQDSPAGIPFLQGCAEFGPHHPVPVQYCLNSPKVAPSRAMLMSVRAPVGRINVADQDYGIGRGLCAIQPGPRWHDRFAYWQLHVLRDCLAMFATGSTYDAVSVGDIANLTLLLPLSSEQRTIADYLDRETAKIDALIARNEVLIERLKEQRAALISRTVTRGLPPDESRKAGVDPHPKLKSSGVKWLGDVPEHWNIRRGKYIMTTVDVRSVTGQEELLTVSAAHGVVPRESVDASVTMFKAESYVGYKLCWPGDLVINSLWAWAFGLGISRYHGIVSSAYGVYRLRKSCEEYIDYIHWLVRSDAFQWELQVRSKGIWVSRLLLTDDAFLSTWFPCPPLHEQAAIAEYLRRAMGRFDSIEELARQEIALLREYRTRLIADVVTGKVDVRNSADAGVKAAE